MNKKCIIYCITISLMLSLIMPFNIYQINADTLPSNEPASYSYFYEITSSESSSFPTSGGTTNGYRVSSLLTVEGKLYDSYVGYANVLVKYSYYSYKFDSSLGYSTNQLSSVSVSHYVAIFGNSFKWVDNLPSLFETNLQIGISVQSVQITVSNVTSYSDLFSLSDVLSVLNNMYSLDEDIQGLASDQLTALTDILTELTNQGITLSDINNTVDNIESYTEIISKFYQYSIPTESILAYSYCITPMIEGKAEIYNYWGRIGNTYPILHSLVDNIQIQGVTLYPGEYIDLIIGYSFVSSASAWSNYISFDNSKVTVSNSLLFNMPARFDETDGFFAFRKFHVVNNTSNNQNVHVKIIKLNTYFIPIYYSYSYWENRYSVSNDFALQWGLSNFYLDNIDKLANGDSSSNSSVSSLDDASDSLASNIDSYSQIESDYLDQYNQSLNQIDFSDPFVSNNDFLSGASFVKSVFNSFMQIDILRIMLVIICILLIAKNFL